MSDKANRRWSELRKMGRSAYVLKYGVCGWGLLTAILFVLLETLRMGTASLPFTLVAALILCPIGGYCWGMAMWVMGEYTHELAEKS